MAKDNFSNQFNNKSNTSLIWSITVHVVFFCLLIFTMNKTRPSAPVMVNLIKAEFIDNREIEAKLQRQKILDQQRQEEQLRLEKIEQDRLAKEQLKLEELKKQQDLKKQEEIKKQEALKKQDLLKKQQIENKKLADKKQAAVSAIKSKQDRIQAERNAFLVTEVDRYKAEIAASIKDNKIESSIFPKDARCTLHIKLLPDGSILSINILQSSGYPAYDQMQISAVRKSAPFTMPAENDLYALLRDIVLSLRNGEESSDA